MKKILSFLLCFGSFFLLNAQDVIKGIILDQSKNLEAIKYDLAEVTIKP
ncbi:MAG: hypothetical protein IPO07_30670 [Haliscomenobacter sp.]|nr:hypothetical protein [Haliscomenobacter sp.]MBK9492654.1 hypothetical protein [Haliscomenobacter sp.]